MSKLEYFSFYNMILFIKMILLFKDTEKIKHFINILFTIFIIIIDIIISFRLI